jgi:hypothetical protein
MDDEIMRRLGILVFVILMLSLCKPALCLDILPTQKGQWLGNGHYYEAVLVPGGITWDQAKKEANDRGGHLATISSEEENQFVYDLFRGDGRFWYSDGAGNSEGPWLGGYQLEGSTEPAGGWAWVTGEPFLYTNWASREPDNGQGRESRLNFFDWGHSQSQTWNDITDSFAALGYIIEWDQSINLTGVWSGNDGGTYYIRQLGNTIWWIGESSISPGRWSNAAKGTISGNVITLEYSDVPKGCAIGYGNLILEVVSNTELRAKSKPASYGGSIWTRIGSTTCPNAATTTTTTTSTTTTMMTPGIGATPTPVPGITITSPISSGSLNPWDDPDIHRFIDEWIAQQDRCVKRVYPNAYIDRWGRTCGQTQTAIISCTLTPDKPADWDNYHYLWAKNWCPDYYPYTVQEYVSLRENGLRFDDLAECKAKDERCYS